MGDVIVLPFEERDERFDGLVADLERAYASRYVTSGALEHLETRVSEAFHRDSGRHYRNILLQRILAEDTRNYSDLFLRLALGDKLRPTGPLRISTYREAPLKPIEQLRLIIMNRLCEVFQEFDHTYGNQPRILDAGTIASLQKLEPLFEIAEHHGLSVSSFPVSLHGEDGLFPYCARLIARQRERRREGKVILLHLNDRVGKILNELYQHTPIAYQAGVRQDARRSFAGISHPAAIYDLMR